ncbi:MAG: TetR/AcrR family transcriptional regulator [Paludibacter sp.]|jgi:AcrR family transcriptional regulator|nr:TetR/AcrR family transcriptional regulator [Paludibacter sp.]
MDINSENSMEQSILDAAEKLFLENGFKSTSTTQIAKEVGCNQALVHYYFRTKDNLFNRIFEKKFGDFFQVIFDTTLLEQLNFTQKIRHICESHFDLLNENPKIPMLILNELSRRPDHIALLREKLHVLPEKLFEIMEKDMQTEIDAGRIRQVNFMDIVLTMVSLNVSLFTLLPMAAQVLQIDENQQKTLLAYRRNENVEIILKYLQP